MMIFVLLIAISLRFFGLGITPEGLYADEASIGYNAYSLLKTGKDEYGKSFPALIKSFGDYKTPVYTYLLVPVYGIWGMNMTTTRSVSAAAGVITVLFLYSLVKLLSGSKRLAVISSLVLAISPWHIMLSRAAIEANVALMYMVVGIWAFIKFVKGGKAFLIPAAIATAVSFTAYHSERFILPLLYVFPGWYYRKIIFSKENLKWLTGGLIAGLLILIPTLLVFNTPAFFARAKNVNILSLKTNELWGFAEGAGIINNRVLLFVREWLSLYATYFSPKYLFGPANPDLRNIYPGTGPLLIWQLPFLIIGAVELIRLKKGDRKNLIILLLLISPLPASLVREPFGMIRALPLVIPLSILIAMGITRFLNKWRFWGAVITGVFVFLGLGRIYLSVFKLNDYYRYLYWDSGVEKAVQEINKFNDQKVQVDSWRAEIYSQLLFFTKYDPIKYQADNGMKDLNNYYNGGPIDQIRQIGRITVKSLDWNRDVYDDRILVGSYKQFGDREIKHYCLTKLFTIRAADNVILYTGAKTNPEVLAKYNELTRTRGDESNDCLSFIEKNKE
jgi:4-amino-4-deoxy-L-arabinose transferase-like glycosyltransferase